MIDSVDKEIAIGIALLAVGLFFVAMPQIRRTWIPREDNLLSENIPIETDGSDYLQLTEEELHGKVRNIQVELEMAEVDGAPFKLHIVGRKGYEEWKRSGEAYGRDPSPPLCFVRKGIWEIDNHYKENFSIDPENLEDGLWFRAEPVYDLNFNPVSKSPLTITCNLTAMWEKTVPYTFMPFQKQIGWLLLGGAIFTFLFSGIFGLPRPRYT